ncbi:Isochorismatase-like protein [Pavlovales sp. CCMP2436]|nr:Isochorismatase-like protein [Pavlovales sp. CCMP2436]|mmetsp:Transcript_14643/g.34109  ORF Transcript_14643/g.34109 Transcript_14643/m.34109 type:complete len:200 (-) Transcript_14643:320-919(-)
MQLAAKVQRLGRLEPATTLFLCCDVQEAFRSAVHRFPAVVATAARMLAAAETLAIPVAVTEQYPKGLKHTVVELDISRCYKVEKTLFSMVTPEVEKWLQAPALMPRRSAVIFGLEAHVCVQQTTLDLLERGFEVHVLVDGVSSQLVSDRTVAFACLQQAGAFLTTSESVLMELIKSKDHKHFKPISSLLKQRPAEPLEY